MLEEAIVKILLAQAVALPITLGSRSGLSGIAAVVQLDRVGRED
jgi:hypothetical protein